MAHTMMAQPIKTLELHYFMIHFLMIEYKEGLSNKPTFFFSVPFQVTPSERAIVVTNIKNIRRRLCYRCGDFCYKHLDIQDVCKETRLCSRSKPGMYSLMNRQEINQ